MLSKFPGLFGRIGQRIAPFTCRGSYILRGVVGLAGWPPLVESGERKNACHGNPYGEFFHAVLGGKPVST